MVASTDFDSAQAEPLVNFASNATRPATRAFGLPWSNPSVKVWHDYDSNHPLAATASLADLDVSTGNVYFYYAAPSMMYVKLQLQTGTHYSTIFIDPV